MRSRRRGWGISGFLPHSMSTTVNDAWGGLFPPSFGFTCLGVDTWHQWMGQNRPPGAVSSGKNAIRSQTPLPSPLSICSQTEKLRASKRCLPAWTYEHESDEEPMSWLVNFVLCILTLKDWVPGATNNGIHRSDTFQKEISTHPVWWTRCECSSWKTSLLHLVHKITRLASPPLNMDYCGSHHQYNLPGKHKFSPFHIIIYFLFHFSYHILMFP